MGRPHWPCLASSPAGGTVLPCRSADVPSRDPRHQPQFQHRRHRRAGAGPGPAGVCRRASDPLQHAGRRADRHREPGRCGERGAAAASDGGSRYRSGGLRHRLLQRPRPVGLPRGHRQAGVRHCRMRRGDGADARRPVRRDRHPDEVDPPPSSAAAQLGPHGPAGRRAGAGDERRRDRIRRGHAGPHDRRRHRAARRGRRRGGGDGLRTAPIAMATGAVRFG